MAAIRVVTREEVCVPNQEAQRGEVSKTTLYISETKPSLLISEGFLTGGDKKMLQDGMSYSAR